MAQRGAFLSRNCSIWLNSRLRLLCVYSFSTGSPLHLPGFFLKGFQFPPTSQKMFHISMLTAWKMSAWINELHFFSSVWHVIFFTHFYFHMRILFLLRFPQVFICRHNVKMHFNRFTILYYLHNYIYSMYLFLWVWASGFYAGAARLNRHYRATNCTCRL